MINVVLKPSLTAEQKKNISLAEAFKYFAVAMGINAVILAIAAFLKALLGIVLGKSSVLGIILQPIGAVLGVVLVAIGVLILIAIFMAVVWVVLKLLGGKGNFSTTYAYTLFAVAPFLIISQVFNAIALLFSVIPLLGTLVGMIVGLVGLVVEIYCWFYVVVRGLQHIHEVSFARALAAVVLPIVVVLVLVVLIGLIVGVGSVVLLTSMFSAMS